MDDDANVVAGCEYGENGNDTVVEYADCDDDTGTAVTCYATANEAVGCHGYVDDGDCGVLMVTILAIMMMMVVRMIMTMMMTVMASVSS